MQQVQGTKTQQLALAAQERPALAAIEEQQARALRAQAVVYTPPASMRCRLPIWAENRKALHSFLQPCQCHCSREPHGVPEILPGERPPGRRDMRWKARRELPADPQ